MQLVLLSFYWDKSFFLTALVSYCYFYLQILLLRSFKA